MIDLLRRLSRRLGAHRAFSAVGALALAGLLVLARHARERSTGILSDPLVRGAIAESVYGIGTVTASRSYQVKLGIVGTIRAIHVREGDLVRPGAPLIQVDGLAYRAPFAGTVTFLPYKVGENIFPQLPVLSLVDLADRYVIVAFEQQGALQLKPGLKASMSFDSLREQSFSGTVRSVYPGSGNFLARVDAAQLPPQILPEMTADVAIIVREKPDALLAPAAALDRNGLWVKRGSGLPRRVPVTIGVADKDIVEILSGDVRAGDRVLIKGKTR